MQLKSCVNIAWVVFINTPLQTEIHEIHKKQGKQTGKGFLVQTDSR